MTLTDDLGRKVVLPTWPPQRIVSLVPSITETLFALGGGPRVVGCTRWCIHPAQGVAGITKVGGTKKVNYSRIDALEPDLILCVQEENTPDMVEHLAQRWPVYVFKVERLPDASRLIGQLGQFLQQEPLTQALIRGEAAHLVPPLPTNEPVPAYAVVRPHRQTPPASGFIRVAYLIWEEPTMAVGPQTFIDDVLANAHMLNVFGHAHPTLHQPHVQRYPIITTADLQAAAPDVLLLSSEPYSYAPHHADAYAALLPNTHVALVNGEVFSWYGIRMYQASAYMPRLLARFYPTIFAEH